MNKSNKSAMGSHAAPKQLSVAIAFVLGLSLGGSFDWGKQAESPKAARKILYYRHPMGAADTSPMPKKDEMGMDYLPVYEDETLEPGSVPIHPGKIQKLGVATEKAEKRKLASSLRAFGSIQADGERVYTIASKYEGWVQHLFLTATGVPVKLGQPILDVYSPELLALQKEYLEARRRLAAAKSGKTRGELERLASDLLQRLRHWDLGPEQLQQLQAEGAEPLEVLPLLSPANGVVLEKKIEEGSRFWRGEVLFRIAELSRVWFEADIFEKDLAMVQKGQGVTVNIDAYPGRDFNGRVDFIAPTLSQPTHTLQIRVALPNDAGLLKLGMYGSLQLTAQDASEVLAVPESAVIDSGKRQIVLVRKEASFEPRQVKLGRRAGDYVEILEGVKAGETVATRANFLIDAESNLKAALKGMAAK